MKLGRPPKSKEDQIALFWSRVKIGTPQECWPWLAGGKNPNLPSEDYGSFYYQGKSIPSHKLAFILSGGVVGDGQVVLHKCDNPRCCNPSHLRSGTHSDNIYDCISKGRRWYQKDRSNYVFAPNSRWVSRI